VRRRRPTRWRAGSIARPPPSPCNDYDFFNSDPTIHSNVAHTSGIVGPKLDLKPAGAADNKWNPATYQRDFDNARLLGLNSLRISLEWSRIAL